MRKRTGYSAPVTVRSDRNGASILLNRGNIVFVHVSHRDRRDILDDRLSQDLFASDFFFAEAELHRGLVHYGQRILENPGKHFAVRRQKGRAMTTVF